MVSLWAYLQDESNRAVLGWIGGGLVVVVGALWAVFKFFFLKGKKNTSAPSVTATHGGIAVGRDILHSAIKVGLDEKDIGRIIAIEHQKIAELINQVERKKGVEIPPLRAILIKVGEAGWRDEDIPKVLDKIADELIAVRKELAELRSGPPDVASSAQQTQQFLDKGDIHGALSSVFAMMQMQENDFRNAMSISTSMQSDNQKQQIERWRILQDVKRQISSIQQDVTANKASTEWDKYIRS